MCWPEALYARRVYPWLAALVDAQVPGLQEPHRTWVLDLGVLILSSNMASAADGYLGGCVDLFAPGVLVQTTLMRSDTDTTATTGTSLQLTLSVPRGLSCSS